MEDEELLEDQRAYYRGRAPKYDDWWQRQGRYDRGEDDAREWREQVTIVEAALGAFGATCDVVELAGGTGWWTARLAETADRLTVVDASPETIALNRERVRRADVEYVIADLFDWTPERSWDVVFFSFWISHVPRSRFTSFWQLVRTCLAPGGRVFLIDNRSNPTPRPNADDRHVKDPYVVEYAPDLHLRQLDDGSEFRVVKVMYEPEELQSLIESEGMRADIRATRSFLYGSATVA
ncbi:MAG TPA: class I SAM-dependent methyltransferase [Ilumatobacteraceae bacterium]|nr:class I SAM-dependent methyltransferase [Ilumatobacteraceae bacterium]